jgi:hypothetical protein
LFVRGELILKYPVDNKQEIGDYFSNIVQAALSGLKWSSAEEKIQLIDLAKTTTA